MNKFIGCEAPFKTSSIVIKGVPFDGTASYRPGSRFAPQHIRQEADGIETYSPYQDKDLTDYLIHDGGDVEISFGNTAQILKDTKDAIEAIVSAGKKPFVIGGEHLVSLPAIEACISTYPNLKIIHFDAHTDLREDYMDQPLSHATVLKRVGDILGDHSIYQFGIRSGTKTEFEYAKAHQYLEFASAATIPNILPEIQDYPIYVTVDIDVLDPSIMSGTGTPEAGGLTYKELMRALLQLQGLNIVGADLVELAPHYDHSGASTATACTLVRELLLLLT